MLTLAIETSGRTGAVALARDGATVDERTLRQAGRRHAQTLVDEIDEMLRRHRIAPGEIELVAVSIGPGSFTGLRVGVVCAKTLAWATGCALVAVDTFACVAANAPPDAERVFVIGDAQRGDLYVGDYRRDDSGDFVRQGEIEIVAAEAWCQARSPADVVSGPGVEPFEDLLAGRCRLLPPEAREPQAVLVARLGEQSFQAGRSDDPWALEPLYLRRSAAEEKWDLLHGRERKGERGRLGEGEQG